MIICLHSGRIITFFLMDDAGFVGILFPEFQISFIREAQFYIVFCRQEKITNTRLALRIIKIFALFSLDSVVIHFSQHLITPS